MNKELMTNFVISCLTLTVLFFSLEVFSSDIEFQYINIIPYFVSSLIGGLIGVLYYKFIGFRFTKYQFLSNLIATALFTLLIIKSGVFNYWILYDLALLVSFILTLSNLSENKRKSVVVQ